MMSGTLRRRGAACLDYDGGGAAKRPALEGGGGGGTVGGGDDELALAGVAAIKLDADECSGSGHVAVEDSIAVKDSIGFVDDTPPPLLRMLCDGYAREVLFTALNTKDAAALRATSPRLRDEVAQHPWDGAPLHPFKLGCDLPAGTFFARNLAGWCTSFPRARHAAIRWRGALDRYNSQLALLRNLERVQIDVQNTADPALRCMDLSSLRAVRELIVASTRYSSPTAASYQVLLGVMPRIAHLELRHCSFDSRTLTALPTLHTLVVVSCVDFDSSVLAHLPNLVQLDVSCSRVNVAHLAALTQLRVLRAQKLVTGHNLPLTDAHLEPLTRLRQLWLYNAHHVTGVALLGMPDLTHVSLRRCTNVTNDVVRALWASAASKSVPCELLLCGCMQLTPACVPVEYDDPWSDQLTRAFGDMLITRKALERAVGDIMYRSRVVATGERIYPTDDERRDAADAHIQLHAIIKNLVVNDQMGTVVVDVSIDHH